MQNIRFFPILLCLLILFCACSGTTQPVASATVAPGTDTPETAVPTPEPTDEPTPALTATPEPTPTPTHTPEPTPALITNEMLDSGMFDSYFDDALFVGDSLTATFSHYVRDVRNAGDPTYLGGAQFMGVYSMSTRRASDNRVVEKGKNFKYRGRDVTLTDGITQYGAKKVFLLLGLNDLCIRDWNEVLGCFAKIIDQVRENCPDVQLIIEAELPVRKTFYDKEDPKWNDFNVGLEALCKEKEVDFLNFSEELMDETGELSAAYCGDGRCHLNIEGEQIWVRALRRFAVEQTHGSVVFEGE